MRGEEHELNTRLAASSMMLFGSLEQSHGGKIKAGTLTESRREAFADLVMSQAPFFDWQKPEEKSGQPATHSSEEEDRKAFLDEYNNWVNKGSPVIASKLEYSERDAR